MWQKRWRRRYGIPYVEVSFFGKTEMAKALQINQLKALELQGLELSEKIEETVIARKKEALDEKLKAMRISKGKRRCSILAE